MTVYDLAALRMCADEACDAAFKDESCRHDAINWGDLACVTAEHYNNDGGDAGYRVWIEEADPGAINLRNFILDHLAKAGFVDVDVITEW